MRLVMLLIATVAAEQRQELAPPPRRVLLIGDSISMGYNFPAGRPTPCPPAGKCQTGKIECGCQPDNRLGYGLYAVLVHMGGSANSGTLLAPMCPTFQLLNSSVLCMCLPFFFTCLRVV